MSRREIVGEYGVRRDGEGGFLARVEVREGAVRVVGTSRVFGTESEAEEWGKRAADFAARAHGKWAKA